MASKTGAEAYENDASYAPHPTHNQPVDLARASHKTPNYRPTSLRWYFVVAQILFIMAAMGVVLWARQAWPDSDNSADIEYKRSIHDEQPRQDLSPRQDDSSEDDSFRTTVTYISEISEAGSFTVTVPGTTEVITTQESVPVVTSYWTTIGGDDDAQPSDAVYTSTITVSGEDGEEDTYTTTVTEQGPPNDAAPSTVLVTTTSYELAATTYTTTQEPEVYITYGEVRVTRTAVITDPDEMPSNIIRGTGRVVDVVSTRAATTIQKVETIGPVTIVTTDSQGQWVTSTTEGGLTTVQTTIEGTTMTYESTQGATGTSAPGDEVVEIYKITEAEYSAGKFAPALVAVLIAIPLRIMDLNAQLFQPFYAMNKPEGAHGSSSMILHYSGWTGMLKPFTTLADGHPVTFITMLLVLCSSLMTPLATEAIGVKIHGSCKINSAAGCAAALGISPIPTHALLALLAFTVVLLCVLLYYLRNFETGLYANPWSIAGIASLASNREIRPKQVTENKIFKEMKDHRYRLGYFRDGNSQAEYGILVDQSTSQDLQEKGPQKRLRKGNPFIALGVFWRTLFAAFLLGLLVLILYYHITLRRQSNFKSFINGQTFGVRFLFSSLGVILSFGWTALFISVATISPYKKLSDKAQSASNSILLTRPTNGYSGLYSSIKHGQPYLGLVAFMTMLSNFMPLLLVNIPFTLTQSYRTHVICARLTMGILFMMLLTLFGSFFIRWPDMPVDPRSIAGAMYYVSDSSIADQFAGLVILSNKKRKMRLKEMGGRYRYGQVLTRDGETKMTVEVDHAIPTHGT